MAITQLPHYAAAAPRLASVCFANGQQLYQDTASTSSTLNHSHVPCLSSVRFLILAEFGGRRGVRRGGQLGRWRRGDGGDILRTPRPQLQWRSFNCISNSCRPRQISFAVNSILIFIWSGLGRVPGPSCRVITSATRVPAASRASAQTQLFLTNSHLSCALSTFLFI